MSQRRPRRRLLHQDSHRSERQPDYHAAHQRPDISERHSFDPLIRLSAYPLIRLSAYPLIRLSAHPLIRSSAYLLQMMIAPQFPPAPPMLEEPPKERPRDEDELVVPWLWKRDGTCDGSV